MRDVIEMARESWLDTYGLGKDHISFVEALKRFADLVRADEREACARVCDEYSATGKIEEFDRGWLACAKNTAAAIRARDTK